MRVDLAHTSSYPSFRPVSCALFLTLLLFKFFLFSFSVSKRKREGREKGERIDKEECHFLRALFCLPIFFVHLSSILFLALPIKIVFLLSLLSPSLSLLFSCSPLNDKNTRKEEQEGMEAMFLSFPMDGESERGWLLVRRPSPRCSKSLLSPYRLFSFPCSQTEKENGFLYMFIVLPFVFYLKGKDKKERKEENEHHLLFA